MNRPCSYSVEYHYLSRIDQTYVFFWRVKRHVFDMRIMPERD